MIERLIVAALMTLFFANGIMIIRNARVFVFRTKFIKAALRYSILNDVDVPLPDVVLGTYHYQLSPLNGLTIKETVKDKELYEKIMEYA
jgi:hypothetical protein